MQSVWGVTRAQQKHSIGEYGMKVSTLSEKTAPHGNHYASSATAAKFGVVSISETCAMYPRKTEMLVAASPKLYFSGLSNNTAICNEEGKLKCTKHQVLPVKEDKRASQQRFCNAFWSYHRQYLMSPNHQEHTGDLCFCQAWRTGQSR